jgi:hypothetical protein
MRAAVGMSSRSRRRWRARAVGFAASRAHQVATIGLQVEGQVQGLVEHCRSRSRSGGHSAEGSQVTRSRRAPWRRHSTSAMVYRSTGSDDSSRWRASAAVSNYRRASRSARDAGTGSRLPAMPAASRATPISRSVPSAGQIAVRPPRGRYCAEPKRPRRRQRRSRSGLREMRRSRGRIPPTRKLTAGR